MRWSGLQSLVWAGIALPWMSTVADADGAQGAHPSEFLLLVQIALRGPLSRVVDT